MNSTTASTFTTAAGQRSVQLMSRLAAELTRRLRPQPTRPEVEREDRAGLRRATGPTAWFVLSDLVSRVDRRDIHQGRAAVSTNVRTIAAATGISKDTVARALQRLIALGVVERVEDRDGRSGRFASSVYVIAIDDFDLDRHLRLATAR
jgi:DNA-binding MarR family transcriptional regulator